jgi:hypothetical protein
LLFNALNNDLRLRGDPVDAEAAPESRDRAGSSAEDSGRRTAPAAPTPGSPLNRDVSTNGVPAGHTVQSTGYRVALGVMAQLRPPVVAFCAPA